MFLNENALEWKAQSFAYVLWGDFVNESSSKLMHQDRRET